MLAKCLKYDLKSVFKIWWIAAVAVLALAVPTGLSAQILNYAQLESEYGSAIYSLLSIASSFVTLAAYFAVIVFTTMTAILVYVRFYRNFFTDEGYLTFTLPVNRKTLLFSKILNGMIWHVATNVVVSVFVLVVLLMMPSGDSSAMGDVNALMDSLFPDSFVLWRLLYFLEFTVITFLAALIGYLWVYLCITVASVLVRKYRALLSIGLIYGTGQILGFVYYAFLFGLIFFGLGSASLFPNITEAQGLPLIALGLLLVCIVLATVAALIWNAILALMERKLNLA